MEREKEEQEAFRAISLPLPVSRPAGHKRVYFAMVSGARRYFATNAALG